MVVGESMPSSTTAFTFTRRKTVTNYHCVYETSMGKIAEVMHWISAQSKRSQTVTEEEKHQNAPAVYYLIIRAKYTTYRPK